MAFNDLGKTFVLSAASNNALKSVITYSFTPFFWVFHLLVSSEKS